jgi:hypothetical protein
MNRTDRDATRIVRSWLEDGVTQLPDRVLDAVMADLPATPQRRAGWLARRSPTMSNTVRFLAAAAAVAAVVVALLAYQAISAPNVGSSGPSRSSSPMPTQTPAPSQALVDFGDHPFGERLAAGSYAFSHVTPLRVTFTVPSGWEKGALDWVVWSVENDKATMAVIGVDDIYVDPCHPEVGLSDPPIGPSVDDLASALGNVPGLTFTEPTDVSLGGFAGKYLEYVPPSTFADCAEEILLWSVNEGTSAQPAPGGDDSFNIWILDVRGSRLVITTSSSPAVPSNRVTQLGSIVDSIRIE